jgi:hypothetical protein
VCIHQLIDERKTLAKCLFYLAFLFLSEGFEEYARDISFNYVLMAIKCTTHMLAVTGEEILKFTAMNYQGVKGVKNPSTLNDFLFIQIRVHYFILNRINSFGVGIIHIKKEKC